MPAPITNGETGASARSKINTAFTELAAALADILLKAPINNPTFTGTVGGITKSMVGLSNADNTSDANKPVSMAQQAALDAKLDANLATEITTAKTSFGNTDKGILLDADAGDAAKTFTGAVMRTKPVVVLGTTGTVNLDFDVLVGCLGTIAAAGDITLTTSNRSAGKGTELRIEAVGGARTVTYPAWNAFGAALTTSLTSGQVLRIAAECTGTTDASIDATSILKV